MPEDKFIFLGKRIRSARKECQLTQQELADQSGLAVKTIQDIEKGITEVVFDRGGFIYQGKIKALADAAREAGLNF